jgi:hypothetical protein
MWREGGRRRTEIDVYARCEELPDHLHDVGAPHAQFACQREALGHVLRGKHGAAHALFEQAELCALRDGVAHSQLDHVVSALQGDHVVVHAWAWDLGVVLEVELLGLEVGLGERSCGDLDAGVVEAECQVGEDVFLLLLGEVPEDNDAVAEDEHLAKGQGVGRDACAGVGVAAVAVAVRVGEEVGRLVRALVVVAHVVRLFVAKVTLLVVAGFVALDLLVEDRLPAGRLEGGAAAHAITVAGRKQWQVVDAVQAVVVELGAGVVRVLDKGSGALHLVGLRSAVGRHARELVGSAGLGQALCIALVCGPNLAAAKLSVGGRPGLFVLVELAPLVLVDLVRLGQQDELLAELGRARRHVRGNQAAGELGVERMAAAGRAVVVRRAHARRPAALLRGNVGGILQDVVDADQARARGLSLERRGRPLLLAGLRVPRVGHEHRRPSLALRRGCAHLAGSNWRAVCCVVVGPAGIGSCSSMRKVRLRHVMPVHGPSTFMQPCLLHMPTACNTIG